MMTEKQKQYVMNASYMMLLNQEEDRSYIENNTKDMVEERIANFLDKLL
jgi:hypothetical protein